VLRQTSFRVRNKRLFLLIPSPSFKFSALIKLLGIAAALGVLCIGCQKPKSRMRAAEIHAITHELAQAASTVAKSTDVRADLKASDNEPESTDLLDIRLVAASSDTERPETTRLLQSLGRVATNHGLTQESIESREGILFSYSRGGYATHMVHVHTSVAQSSQENSQPPSQAASGGTGRLAIILDDLGTDRSAADAIFGLPYALTISVLPDRPHSVDIAEAAHSRGYEVMLHVPMESTGHRNAESRELRPGMQATEVVALVNEFVRAVPGVAGVNNHQGSQSTADLRLMNELMGVLRERNLFYIDSRTTAATVAYDAARQAGVHSAFRNVPFLDDVADSAAVKKQLRLALRVAREKGEAIAIGHPHRATLTALREVLPQAKAQGVDLVFASELVH
jgi:uncharacterized protein